MFVIIWGYIQKFVDLCGIRVGFDFVNVCLGDVVDFSKLKGRQYLVLNVELFWIIFRDDDCFWFQIQYVREDIMCFWVVRGCVGCGQWWSEQDQVVVMLVEIGGFNFVVFFKNNDFCVDVVVFKVRCQNVFGGGICGYVDGIVIQICYRFCVQFGVCYYVECVYEVRQRVCEVQFGVVGLGLVRQFDNYVDVVRLQCRLMLCSGNRNDFQVVFGFVKEGCGQIFIQVDVYIFLVIFVVDFCEVKERVVVVRVQQFVMVQSCVQMVVSCSSICSQKVSSGKVKYFEFYRCFFLLF